VGRQREEREDEEQHAMYWVFGQYYAQRTQQGYERQEEKERHKGCHAELAKHLITFAPLG
jgi:hypothetical protein